MVQDRLEKAVLRRLKELGLPPSLIEVEVFRDAFLSQGWVMFVRDGDDAANVHLVQPRPGLTLSGRGATGRRSPPRQR